MNTDCLFLLCFMWRTRRSREQNFRHTRVLPFYRSTVKILGFVSLTSRMPTGTILCIAVSNRFLQLLFYTFDVVLHPRCCSTPSTLFYTLDVVLPPQPLFFRKISTPLCYSSATPSCYSSATPSCLPWSVVFCRRQCLKLSP